MDENQTIEMLEWETPYLLNHWLLLGHRGNIVVKIDKEEY